MTDLSEKDFDAEGEARFRRGYIHGVQAMFDAVKSHLSEPQVEKLNVWVSNVLRQWQVQGPFEPPVMPDLNK